VDDLEKMRDFYERVIGLTVTDEDDEQGIVFFSAQRCGQGQSLVVAAGGGRPPGPRGAVAGVTVRMGRIRTFA
jgi:catechol 2,3-dioxygenase-like lactoylglutathione lyase family enzyme